MNRIWPTRRGSCAVPIHGYPCPDFGDCVGQHTSANRIRTMTAPSTSGALSKKPTQLRHFSTDFRPCARHRDRASCYLRGFLRALVPGLLVDPVADYGHGGLPTPARDETGGTLVCPVCLYRANAHGLIAFGLGYLAHIWTGFSPGVWFYFRSSPHPTATFQGRPLCGPPYRAQTRQPTLAPVPRSVLR